MRGRTYPATLRTPAEQEVLCDRRVSCATESGVRRVRCGADARVIYEGDDLCLDCVAREIAAMPEDERAEQLANVTDLDGYALDAELRQELGDEVEAYADV